MLMVHASGQPRRRKRGGRPPVRVTPEFSSFLLESLVDPEKKFIAVDMPLSKPQIVAIRDQLRKEATQLARENPELCAPGDRARPAHERLRVALIVADKDNYEIASGGAKGRTDWLEDIPETGEFYLWFRLHRPLDVGARVRKDTAPGGHLLVRTAPLARSGRGR